MWEWGGGGERLIQCLRLSEADDVRGIPLTGGFCLLGNGWELKPLLSSRLRCDVSLKTGSSSGEGAAAILGRFRGEPLSLRALWLELVEDREMLPWKLFRSPPREEPLLKEEWCGLDKRTTGSPVSTLSFLSSRSRHFTERC